MTTTNLHKLENDLKAVLEILRATAETLAKSNHFTNEGKLDQWRKYLTTHQAKLDTLRENVATARLGADQMLNYARTSAIGPAPDPANPNMPAELAVARILPRHTTWNLNIARKEIEPLLGTATGALLIEELAARDLLDATSLDALVENMAPDVATARKAQQLAYTAINNIINPLLEAVDELIQRGPNAPGASAPGGINRNPYVTVTDILGDRDSTINSNGQTTINA
ncbi:hypothetical protein CKJ81_04455 [Corynebacterium hadale]|uniref:DUF222 domain-containing protein n=1 Tax=Corynebacterium hadale TaxID=2026255 RepID=A0ABX4HA46_9CORY|nr:hypothetical protein [Corynebacterium hadale]PAT06222.1 hypothetical protein CKJ81_04455 [Corynebacterium hadale]